MMSDTSIKKIVQDKYAAIARANSGQSSCCGGPAQSSCCSPQTPDYSVFSDDYSRLDGYVAEADMNLGCGLPTEHAGIRNGDVVVDLGCGAGNDVFVARNLVGETGRVIGVDMTPEMITKARENKRKLAFTNVDFRLGEIEALPVDKSSVDVVISNCVLNLVPDKLAAFAEIHRVLKPGAHFCISDVVYQGRMSESLLRSAELYAGCVAGALEEQKYLNIIREAGFYDVEIKVRKSIHLPDSLLQQYLSMDDVRRFNENEFGLFSITVVGYKAQEEEA